MGEWGEGGSVSVLTRRSDSLGNDYLLAGGLYRTGSSATGRVASWDGLRWRWLGEGFDREPTALLGTMTAVFAAGAFTTADGRPAHYVSQYTGGGWHPMADLQIMGTANSLCLYNGSVYVGGSLELLESGLPFRVPFARWDGLNWHGTFGYGEGFEPGHTTYALTGFAGDLYLGGNFHYRDALDTEGDLVGADSLLRLSWDTRWNRWDAYRVGEGISGTPYSMVAIDGTLYIGGGIRSVGTDDAYNVVALSSGYTYTALPEPPVTADVQAMTALGGSLVVAMSDYRDRVVQRYVPGPSPYWIGPLGGTFMASVNAVSTIGDRLYAGGAFGAGVVAWDEGEWVPVGGGIGRVGLTEHEIWALAEYGGDLIAGGDFIMPSAIEAVASQNIARWNGRYWHYMDRGMNFPVHALAVYDGDLIAGGAFTTAGDRLISCIARWDGTGWHEIGGMNMTVRALAVLDTSLVAGGFFTQAGGVTAQRVARWNGTAWSQMGAGFDAGVRALAVEEGVLYAAGDFTRSGAVAMNGVARWDGSQWQPLGSGLSGGSVLSLALHAGDLYAGGRFTSSGGVPVDRLARWTGTEWVEVGGGFSGSAVQLGVTALRSIGGELYAGGNFVSAGGTDAGAVAVWNGAAWRGLGTGVHGGYLAGETAVYDMLVMDGDLYLAGNFYEAGGTPSIYLARWPDIEP